jgi:hypothetical protein
VLVADEGRERGEGLGLNQTSWTANLGEIEGDLEQLDPVLAAELIAAIQEFFAEYYPAGLDGRELDRHRRERNLRRRWRVDEAEAARPEKVWEFRPEQGSNYRVLFGEHPGTRVVLFLGLIMKSQGSRRQTSAMKRAANRLRRRLGR